jgi:hypothetical protein
MASVGGSNGYHTFGQCVVVAGRLGLPFEIINQIPGQITNYQLCPTVLRSGRERKIVSAFFEKRANVLQTAVTSFVNARYLASPEISSSIPPHNSFR